MHLKYHKIFLKHFSLFSAELYCTFQILEHKEIVIYRKIVI